ncbi:glycosyltransferase family 4 protein [Halochromatium glycolicum]|uniref:glycosyltransferase family 4 protein n=1 Tax=Halochromatium glycolicum TaxID=85075 RepID=UPI0019097D73|nr:glycosyltransferase family 4 protein [Halochromatium glycolicum]
MRILFLSPTAQAGTAQYNHNLMNALADRGHEITLVTSLGYELAEFPRRYQLLEVIDRYRLQYSRLAALLRLLRVLRPEIIHFQGAQRPATYVVAWIALRLLTRARFVYTPQDILPFSERSHHTHMLRFFYGRMAHVFLNAQQNLATATKLFGVDRAKLTVLPMPDLLAFMREQDVAVPPPIPDGRRVVLFFGQIQERKGVDLLIDAFAETLRQVPDIHLAIAGKAYMNTKPLEAQIECLGLTEHVSFRPGYATFAEMAGYFERCDIVALPYRYGWNSGVLASAFGYGKAVIATRVGGFDEVVVDRYNGLLIPPCDSSALAQALINMLSDGRVYHELCAGATETAGRHSWGQVAELTEQCYLNVLGRTAPKSA